MKYVAHRWGDLAAIMLLVLGVVLSPLRAMAATIPTLAGYDGAARPTATTVLGEYDAERPEAEPTCVIAYASAHFGYDDPSNPRVASAASVLRAYDAALENADRGELLAEGAISRVPFATTAAEGGGAAINVTAKGLARIEGHLGQLGALEEPANAAMLVMVAEPYPIKSVKITVVDAEVDAVSSSMMAFRHAGRDAGGKFLEMRRAP